LTTGHLSSRHLVFVGGMRGVGGCGCGADGSMGILKTKPVDNCVRGGMHSVAVVVGCVDILLDVICGVESAPRITTPCFSNLGWRGTLNNRNLEPQPASVQTRLYKREKSLYGLVRSEKPRTFCTSGFCTRHPRKPYPKLCI
jgi:hypothetical protein